MQRFILPEPVVVSGFNFWGWDSEIKLVPVRERGWFWKAGDDIVPLKPSLVKKQARRLTLEHNGYRLHAVEHITVLRWSGLDSVCIECPRNSWPPYDGSARALWREVKRTMIPDGTLHRYSLTEKAVAATSPRRIVFFDGECGHDLALQIFVHYRGLGGDTFVFSPFAPNDWEKIVRTPTQGWPRSARIIASIVDRLGWPHRHHVWWATGKEAKESLLAFARHRALDILGGLAFLCPPGGLLVGVLDSIRGGHATDLKLLQIVSSRQIGGVALCA